MSEISDRNGETITVSATFTANPLADPIGFWLECMHLPHVIDFTPPVPLIQLLLDSNSALSINNVGLNVILFRWEDLAGKDSDSLAVSEEFTKALQVCVSNNPIAHLVISCPSSAVVSMDKRQLYNDWDKLLAQEFANHSSPRVVTARELQPIHPDQTTDTVFGEQLAQIPYPPAMYAGIATVIARQIYMLQVPSAKVIVVDCDDTLWGGVCGEDGPLGINIGEPYMAIQRQLVAQQTQGVLICLCSKNNDDDVQAVFRQRTDMILRSEHITASRINWDSKAQNILSLAAELDLSPDSFIFLDDNPVECEQVRLALPNVLTLELPGRPENYEAFMDSVWAFDRLQTTDEDRQRTSFYANQRRRESLRDTSSSLQTFMNSLDLDVSFINVKNEFLARASQLTYRVNQFNLSPYQRSEAVLARLLREGKYSGRLASVSDRFGDYGMTGLMIYEASEDTLLVDTFLLSCRALGRGVEYRMLNQLAKVADDMGLSTVEMQLTRSDRNQPIEDFLQTMSGNTETHTPGRYRFSLAVALAAQPDFSVQREPQNDMPHVTLPGAMQTADTDASIIASERSALLAWIASELTDTETLLAAIEAWRRRERPEISDTAVSAETDLERQIATIWEEVLALDGVGIHDNFFELGGDSLLMVRIIVRMYEATGIEFPISAFFEVPTIKAHAVMLAAAMSDDASIARLSDIDPI